MLWHTTVILTPGKQRQEDQECKIICNYTWSSEPAWATQDQGKKKAERRKKEDEEEEGRKEKEKDKERGSLCWALTGLRPMHMPFDVCPVHRAECPNCQAPVVSQHWAHGHP